MNPALFIKIWHDRYKYAHSDTKAAIDAAFDVMAQSLTNDGFVCVSNDPAEELIAAITAYVYAGNFEKIGE